MFTSRFIRQFSHRFFPDAAARDLRTERRRLGDRGEAFAADFYRARGYVILAQNWRHGRDELDLVVMARGGDVPVFVEVKTRSENDLKGGYHAVDTRKRRALQRAVRAYLSATHATGASFRFDIAEVRVSNGADGAPSCLRVIHHCGVPLFPN